MGDTQYNVIAKALISRVRKRVTVDRTPHESARARIRGPAKRILDKYRDPPDLLEAAVKSVLKSVLKQAKLIGAAIGA